jgi:prepilin-type processing-associated H-X9-DG protein
MPRPRGGVGGVPVGQPQQTVAMAAIDAPAEVISVTEFTDFLNAVSGNGPGGTAYKSHRPSNAIASSAAGAVYDTSNPMPSALYALAPEVAEETFRAQPEAPFGGGTLPHIVYVNAGRHSGNNNFLFCDGHVKAMRISASLSCGRFMWGKRAYNQVGSPPILCPQTNQPVR